MAERLKSLRALHGHRPGQWQLHRGGNAEVGREDDRGGVVDVFARVLAPGCGAATGAAVHTLDRRSLCG